MIFSSARATLLLIALAVAACGLVGSVWASGGVGGQAALYFLSVGQGDSQLIELPGGVHILIDGGPTGRALLDNLARVLPPNERYIDAVIMTHPQLDHFGGFVDLLKQYEVGVFIGNLRRGPTAGYGALHDELAARGVPYVQMVAGDQVVVGDARLRILSPARADIVSKELNDTCLVVFFETPELTALYTGDIDAHTEEALVKKYNFTVDVLKVAHHGSRFSSSAAFLRAIKPAVAVIEVGKNTYGHPTKQALDRLAASGATVLRTDKEGIIKIVSQDGELRVAGAL